MLLGALFLRELLEAAPALQFVEASVSIHRHNHHLARAVLRNEPPFQALRLRQVRLDDSIADFIALRSCARHAPLEELYIGFAELNTAAAMGAVVDACIALRLRSLEIAWCRIVPAVVPELTRLIAAGSLRSLTVQCCHGGMFGEAHEFTRLFVAAVRASAMTKLRLEALGHAIPESVVRAATLIKARQS